MVRFFCDKCAREISNEMESVNITFGLPKTEHQRTARGNLHVQCARDLTNDLHLTMPVALPISGAPAPRTERDVKTSRVGIMQPARSWSPGSNK